MARQNLGQRAFATAIAAHHRMDLSSANGQIDPFKDRLILHSGTEIADLKQDRGFGANHRERKMGRRTNGQNNLKLAKGLGSYPTEPSSFRASSLSASAANSIGNWLKTSRQKPLTIIETASSKPIPRLCK